MIKQDIKFSLFGLKNTFVFSLFIVFFMICLWQFFLPLISELYFRNAYFFSINKRYKYAFEDYQTAFDNSPWEAHYLMFYSRYYEEYYKKIEGSLSHLEKIHRTTFLIDMYQQMISLDRYNPWFIHSLALLYKRMATLKPEKKSYYLSLFSKHLKQTVEIDRKNPIFLLNYAYYLQQEGLLNEAEVYYKKVIVYDSSIKDAYFNLASIYISKDQMDQALNLYLDLFKRFPSTPKLAFTIANIYIKQAKYYKALPFFEEAFKNNPSNMMVQRSLGVLYYQLQQWRDSARLFSLYFENRKEPDPDVFYLYVQSLANSGQAHIAIQQLNMYLNQYPDDQKARSMLDVIDDYLD